MLFLEKIKQLVPPLQANAKFSSELIVLESQKNNKASVFKNLHRITENACNIKDDNLKNTW